MRAPSTEANVETLLRRAEQAIRAARPREQIERLLEQIIGLAEDGSEASRFAHRQLAEISLEQNPWGAALHLRKVLQNDADDDIAHALMGLCQALQGNFRMAVSEYRRAVALSPANPWYNHNLGHLLDVALAQPHEALGYLRKAHKSQPMQEEVGASLVHCLGAVGAHAEGLALARSLMEKHPRHQDLRLLVGWLEEGAPASRNTRAAMLQAPRSRQPSIPPPMFAPRAMESSGDAAERPRQEEQALTPQQKKTSGKIEATLSEVMLRCGWAQTSVARAVRLWRDGLALIGPSWRETNPAAMAAAIEYALARIDGVPVTQRDVAARYAITLGKLSARYSVLRTVLELQPNDPRYSPGL